MNFEETILNINNAIFKYDTKRANDDLITFLNAVQDVIDQKDQSIFLSNLKKVLEAMENKDYLLISDLIEFEIKPIIRREK